MHNLVCSRQFSKNILAAIVVGSLLSIARDALSQISRDASNPKSSACYLAGRLGIASRTTKLTNAPVRDKDGNKIGKVQDLFLDLNSGGVLCVLMNAGGAEAPVVVPAKTFHSADASGATLDVQTPGMSVAPHCSANADADALLKLLPDAGVFFGQKNCATAQFNAAQCCKASEIIGRCVKNPANAQLGKVVELIADVPTGRVLFAVISFAGGGTDLYAVPPTALRLTPDRSSLVLNAEKASVASLAQSDGFFWANLKEVNAAINVYRAFGQQADFDVACDPDPAHEQVRAKVESVSSANPVPPKADSQIQNEILMAAMRDDVNNAVALQKVKIGCINGHVTLTGRVRNEKFRSKLTAIVASVVGSANFTDQLEVK